MTAPGGEPRERPAATLRALAAVAERAAAAGRLEPPGGEAVLRSVVEATVVLFDAEAASIALHDPGTDRLVIRVAAGDAGEGAVGLAFPSGEGIAGYAFTTGQPLAVSDTAQDPRFGRQAAEQPGYVPPSILAVPMLDDEGTIGVLEVLDKRGSEGFGLRDLDLASVFARQAAVAIRASRVERDAAELLRGVLARLAGGAAGRAAGDADRALGNADEDLLDAAVADAIADLDGDGDDRLWALADAVARARHAAPDQVALVVEILDALARRASPSGTRTFRR